MAGIAHTKKTDLGEVFSFFWSILAPERAFYALAIIYGVSISLLSLAVPISVQMLINTVANIGLAAPLIMLSLTLLGLLLLSALLNAVRIRLMELFGRRFYARLVAEISLRTLYSQNPFFADAGKADLFNRYFDIVTVQKIIPFLLVGGFTVVLQAMVGFVLVSFYHWYFLVFIATFIALVGLVWQIWGWRAIGSGIALSHRKYETARWLEGLGTANGFYKSERHIKHALEKTEEATANYIEQHRRHFQLTFAQTISLLLIYAIASAALLGMGGWLVIERQLSIGQLVAAELVLASAFLGVAQLGSYLNSFYDLCAAIEELSMFWQEPTEEPTGRRRHSAGGAELVFHRVKGAARGCDVVFDLTIPANDQFLASSSSHGVQRLFVNLLKRHETAKGGIITLDGVDILDTNIHRLRQDIIVLDRPTTVEMSIREYLSLACEDTDPSQYLSALKAVGLDKVITELDEGLDTTIAATGWPLSISETLQLKLAAAIIARPRILILNQLYDVVPETLLRRALDHIAAIGTSNVIYFSNRSQAMGFEKFIFLGEDGQEIFDSFPAYQARVAERFDDEPPPSDRPALRAAPLGRIA